MNRIQTYIFLRVFRSAIVIIGGLAMLAILAQGLSRTDIIVENRQSALTYFQIVALGAPQIMALLTPMAMFVAGIWALNRLHSDSEIVVANAAGMSRWQVAQPVIVLAVLAALVHLGVNVAIQPLAQRTMREAVYAARADLASSLVRPGQFTRPDEELAVFARELNGSDFLGIQISERPDAADGRDYLAQRGRFIEVDGRPSIVMFDGEVHQLDEDGALNILRFDQSTFDLTPFIEAPQDLVLKASDRYLTELFWIDSTNPQEVANRDLYFAELNARLATPLTSVSLALLAIIAVLGGHFNRRGYNRRITGASAVALTLIIVQLSLQSASVAQRQFNALQWALPLLTIFILSVLLFRSTLTRPKLRPT